MKRLAWTPSIVPAPQTFPALERVFFCPEKRMTVSEKDRDILARTVWGEARGETSSG